MLGVDVCWFCQGVANCIEHSFYNTYKKTHQKKNWNLYYPECCHCWHGGRQNQGLHCLPFGEVSTLKDTDCSQLKPILLLITIHQIHVSNVNVGKISCILSPLFQALQLMICDWLLATRTEAWEREKSSGEKDVVSQTELIAFQQDLASLRKLAHNNKGALPRVSSFPSTFRSYFIVDRSKLCLVS